MELLDRTLSDTAKFDGQQCPSYGLAHDSPYLRPIVYDIKRVDNATRLRVSRHLRKLGALRFATFVWEFTDFSELRDLIELIKSAGGKVYPFCKKKSPLDDTHRMSFHRN